MSKDASSGREVIVISDSDGSPAPSPAPSPLPSPPPSPPPFPPPSSSPSPILGMRASVAAGGEEGGEGGAAAAAAGSQVRAGGGGTDAGIAPALISPSAGARTYRRRGPAPGGDRGDADSTQHVPLPRMAGTEATQGTLGLPDLAPEGVSFSRNGAGGGAAGSSAAKRKFIDKDLTDNDVYEALRETVTMEERQILQQLRADQRAAKKHETAPSDSRPIVSVAERLAKRRGDDKQ